MRKFLIWMSVLLILAFPWITFDLWNFSIGACIFAQLWLIAFLGLAWAIAERHRRMRHE